MTWQDHIDFDRCTISHGSTSSSMTPGLTNTYDDELREKAGQHVPPPPPEYMGLEGEYDTFGLVRRLAEALDRESDLTAIDTLTLIQHGSTIQLTGQVGDRIILERIVDVASQVDGTRSVDINHVAVSNSSGDEAEISR
ncbi:BON domain-containing protein [Nodosilinea sp. LEGE 07298]|uniref:BON domain-containing protein n=1 Tax=Nodosilinea sp. LEGE 07298 TaxID=2777970 RepID=UPI001880266A|nr:BON domain-containing protein [Nodosilinea sp. LEGE 07298]MBE9108361.1 BON domain-containing protein [Nodosilinea sp. LEGE 07298]